MCIQKPSIGMLLIEPMKGVMPTDMKDFGISFYKVTKVTDNDGDGSGIP